MEKQVNTICRIIIAASILWLAVFVSRGVIHLCNEDLNDHSLYYEHLVYDYIDDAAYEYIINIHDDGMTNKDIWDYYNSHRKTCDSISYINSIDLYK